ncbi:hypothetical protein [Xylophilus sp. ASV27]|uniref:hypothetical protein n=1 Tax=Xylophilus sp. ASV27 TaxID=2795129 RepID=UPI0018EC3467|nr:hypothetical protein [Xylophilus sp. ASV27]
MAGAGAVAGLLGGGVAGLAAGVASLAVGVAGLAAGAGARSGAGAGELPALVRSAGSGALGAATLAVTVDLSLIHI